MPASFITVVSGLPRSGTSMMMQVLKAGGMPILSDGVRSPDLDNPRGYCELEAVKKLKEDASWLIKAQGCAVKVISMLLYELPATYFYRVLFMQRALEEILASQDEMLERRRTAGRDTGNPAIGEHLDAHLRKVQAWLAARPNFRVLYCDYSEMLRAPAEQIRRITTFLEVDLNPEAMGLAIDATLYRHRVGSFHQTGR